MLEARGEFRVDPNEESFSALAQSDPLRAQDILIQDRLRVSCAHNSGEMLEISAQKTNRCDAFYRISPVNMGASKWYSIEYAPLIENVGSSNQLVAILDAASMQSTTIFAICRIFHPDGRSEDVSSRQIEIRKKRKKHVFSINTDGAEIFLNDNIASCRIIFFIEARNVSIDIYGLDITSLATINQKNSAKNMEEIRSIQKTNVLPRLKRDLNAKSRRGWRTKTKEPWALAKNVFIDFEQGSEQEVAVTRRDKHLVVDFSKATGRWRTLEFRFNEVKNTETVFALLHFQGMKLSTPALEVTLVLRQYGDNARWTDVTIPVSLVLHAESKIEQHLIDVSSLLSNDHDYHRFGIFMFFPSGLGAVAIKELEVSVFDATSTHN